MSSKRRSSIEPKWILVLVFFVAGAFTGGLSTYLYTNASPLSTVKLHLPKGTYAYTNPTLATDPASTQTGTASKALELKLQGLINKSSAAGVTHAGLYYRDLEPGTWLDLNGAAQFSPGVLLKIPITITYFRLAQERPAILDESLTFTGPYIKSNSLLEEKSTLEIGKSYTINDLLNRMTVGNDDTAANLLFEHIDKDILNQTFSDLGIDFNEDNVNADFISIRRYSLFFRVLYNAAYLSPEYSEKVLTLLSKNTSRSFLQQHLPQSIRFVSREGGRLLKGSGVEAYECDIVYYPGHDYLLCATAQGDTQQAVSDLFAQLGQVVYDDTSYRYSN